jgi:lipopolysaccharide transport system permease protein
VPIRFGELWAYRELVFFLAWRDVKVRYKQTVIGVGWAVIQPFMTMVVFSVFFGALARIPSDGLPYPLFAFAALVPWTFFANALTSAANSLVGNSTLISRVYFPRLVVPLAAVISAVVDLGCAALVLGTMMVYFGHVPTAAIFAVPALLALTLATALGAGLWLAGLNARYRDIRYVLPFGLQFWMFVTPVAYPASLVPERWRSLYALNPMVGVIEGFRAAFLGGPAPSAGALAASSLVAAVLVLTGAAYLRRVERTIADSI